MSSRTRNEVQSPSIQALKIISERVSLRIAELYALRALVNCMQGERSDQDISENNHKRPQLVAVLINASSNSTMQRKNYITKIQKLSSGRKKKRRVITWLRHKEQKPAYVTICGALLPMAWVTVKDQLMLNAKLKVWIIDKPSHSVFIYI